MLNLRMIKLYHLRVHIDALDIHPQGKNEKDQVRGGGTILCNVVGERAKIIK